MNGNKVTIQHKTALQNMDAQLANKRDRFIWLLEGELKGETESQIIAAQDQALNTKFNATKLLKTIDNSKCRMCQQFDEIVDNLMAVCPTLVKEEWSTSCWVCTQLYPPSPSYMLQGHDKITTLQHEQRSSGEMNFLRDFSLQPAAKFSFIMGSVRYFDCCILHFFVNITIPS
jgi:hypothetical protein